MSTIATFVSAWQIPQKANKTSHSASQLELVPAWWPRPRVKRLFPVLP